jgi:hypothetical protein
VLPPMEAAVSAAFSSDLAMEVCAPIRKNLDSTRRCALPRMPVAGRSQVDCTVGQVSDLLISGLPRLFRPPLSVCGRIGRSIRSTVKAMPTSKLLRLPNFSNETSGSRDWPTSAVERDTSKDFPTVRRHSDNQRALLDVASNNSTRDRESRASLQGST